MSWTSDLAIAVDTDPARPLYARVADAITQAIRRGRLRPGARLPGSRTLARSLDVHRNTVLAAYGELASQGWIAGAQGRGTFVSQALPEAQPHGFARLRRGVPEAVGFSLAPTRSAEPHILGALPQGVLSFAGGVPDPRLAPVAELGRAYRRSLRCPGVLEYGDERGHPRLRAQLAEKLSALRGLTADADDVFVTRGSQQALYLVGRALLAPGSAVAVEALGYPPAWDAFRASGAKLVAVPVDACGLRVDRLRVIAERRRIRAVYLTPHHHYPTTVALSADRRLELLALAREHRFAVIEDDYDNEVHYQGRPILPLASADAAGVVVYVGTLSKSLAPGIRVGFVVAPRPLLDRLAGLRHALDRQGDPAVESAIAELLEDGTLPRHARRMRRVYRARRDALGEALRAELGDAVDFEPPAGGMALWLRVARGIDVDAWAERALRAGTCFRPARAFAFDRRARPFARLGFAPLREEESQEAVRRMRRALPPGRA